MKTFSTLCVAALLASPVLAQTQLVRGEIDSIQGTNRFQIECTRIPVITTNPALNLQNLHDLTRQTQNILEMQVVNVGTASQPMLDVQSATVVAQLFEMGNLRIGRSESWEVFGTPGSMTAVYLTLPGATAYGPFGAAGTWFMGAGAVLFQTGTIAGNGQFRFEFVMPDLPGSVGVEVSSQALILTPSQQLLISNPDCKAVRT